MNESQTSDPANNASESVPIQDNASQEGNGAPRQPAVPSQVRPSPEIRPSPHKANSAEEREDHSPSWKKLLEFGALFVAIGLLIVNFFQMRATQKAADAAKVSVDLARMSAHLDQRAWVGVTEVATPTEVHEGTLLNPTISLVNSGKTPALNVVQRAGYRIVKAGDVFDPAHEVSVSHPFRQGVVQPGGKRMLSIRDLGTISGQRADELTSGIYRLYLFGEITYDDVFHMPHCTRFSMRMELTKPPSFAPYGSYDYAD